METQQHEIVIGGTGEGAKFLAWTPGKQGKRVAVIERKYIGGSCPNIACLPSKNAIHSAKVASYVRRGEEFGIAKEGFQIDMSAVRDRKRKMVGDLVDIHVANFKASSAELIMGSAKFIGPKTFEVSLNEGGIRVGGATLDACFVAVKHFGHVVIGWGTHAIAPLYFREATYSGVFTRTETTMSETHAVTAPPGRPQVPLDGKKRSLRPLRSDGWK